MGAWACLCCSPLLPGYHDELGARLWPSLDARLLLLHLDLSRPPAHNGDQKAETLPDAVVGRLDWLPHRVAGDRARVDHHHLLLIPSHWPRQPPQASSLPLPDFSNSDNI